MSKRPAWVDKAYLGLHHDLHAKATDTELGTELTHDQLREQLQKMRPDFIQCDCKGHEGYASYPTRVGSPSPGIVRDALRIYRDVTRELGIFLLVHYSGMWDQCAVELHGDWAAIDADGMPIHTLDGSPAVVCPLSPYLDELLIPQMLEIIDEYDVDGFWVDGDNWAVRDCYCPRCKAEFIRRTGIEVLPQNRDDPNWIQWRAFQQDLFVEYVRKYADAVHARKPECAVCSNWMYSMRQPGVVEAPIDFLSGDFMSSFGCERAEMEGRYIDGHRMPWNLMAWSFCRTDERVPHQTKTVVHLCQEAAEVLSCGGGFMIYDNPQRSGWVTEWHQDIFAEVAQFVRERQEFCQYTESVPDAVVLQSETHAIHNNPEVFCMGESFYPAEGGLHALIENQYHVDILDEVRLPQRIDDYGLVMVCEQNPISEEIALTLEEYAKRGGVVLMTGANLAQAHGKLVGVEQAGEIRNESWHVAVGDEAAGMAGAWQPVIAKDSVPWTFVMRQQQVGKDETTYPAVTIRSVGKGKIAAIHGDVMLSYYLSHHPRIRRFVRNLLDELDISRGVRVDAPASIEVTLRHSKDNRMMVNLVNRAVHPTLTPRLHIVEEVPPSGPVKVEVLVDKEPKKVTLQPAKREVEWRYDSGWVKTHIDSVGIHDILVIE